MLDAVALFGPPSCLGCASRRALLCPACRARLPPPGPGAPIRHVDRVVAAWPYEGAARALILDLKVAGRRAAAAPLVDAMVAAARAQGLRGDVLAWVPGRPGDRRRRGFDHAELLARGLARRLGLPARPLLSRIADPLDQSGLSARERWRNLRHAFAADRSPAAVVVVDDVVTTGATAAACAAALRRAGADHVEIVAACRA